MPEPSESQKGFFEKLVGETVYGVFTRVNPLGNSGMDKNHVNFPTHAP